MAVDEGLAERVGDCLKGRHGVSQKRMFGGLCFMHRGHMLCGIDNRGRLMVRIGPDQYEKALGMTHAGPMDFTGRPLKGMIYVEPAGFRTKRAMMKWIAMGLKFTGSLPPRPDKQGRG